MKENPITVLKVAPEKHPEVIQLNNDLESLQIAVSEGADYTGLIEIINIEDDVCLLCNEEGKLIGLPGNRAVGNDIIAGTFYLTSEDHEGNLESLPEKLIEKYKEKFWAPEFYNRQDVENAVFMKFYPWEV